MSDTEIMAAALRDDGRKTLGIILQGYGDRVEQISLITRCGNSEIRHEVKLTPVAARSA